MKIITICGSLKFIEEMKVQAELLELAGNCVLSVIYPTKSISDYKPTEITAFSSAHFKKIDLSDTIFVVNKDGYIGESTRKEINYAESEGKEIMYLEKK
ncbi:hypothetical protein [Lactococcus sp.]|uniref:hypothetical protein n=1 Tax=Lactococcus sp. TaxID=44273 RepID=UPI002FC5B0C2